MWCPCIPASGAWLFPELMPVTFLCLGLTFAELPKTLKWHGLYSVFKVFQMAHALSKLTRQLLVTKKKQLKIFYFFKGEFMNQLEEGRSPIQW